MERSVMLLAVTLVLYLIIVALGFPQAVGIGLAVTRLHGCPLFTELVPPGMFPPAVFGSLQHCNYVTFMPVIVSLVYGFIMVIYHAYGLIQALRRPNIPSQMWISPWIGGAVVGLILTVVGAGLLSAGLYWFCYSNRALISRMFQGLSIKCTTGEATIALFGGYDPYYDLLASEVTYWLSVIMWLAVVVVTIVRHVMVGRERGQNVDASGRPSAEIFRGVTLLPDKFQKRPKDSSTTTILPERSPMTQFETKVKPLETAA